VQNYLKRKNNVNYFNEYKIYEDGTCEFYIINRKKMKFVVKVDKEDLERLIKFNRPWHAWYSPHTKTYYPRAIIYKETINGKSIEETIYLNRWIVNAKENETIDHKNHDSLDNTKGNLRTTIDANNSSNRRGANTNSKTGVRNVHLVNRYEGEQEYWVQIMKNGIHYKWEFGLHEFDKACEFAKEKRKELFGEYAGKGDKKII